ncbi:MAG TPA: glycosyltransferase family 4 protein [Steroidobacteraceae bacterium]|nr:glycosyltransferase family 4 protein [Steroidobacteraceae bacterium]
MKRVQEQPLAGRSVIVVSRCAKTLHLFRRNLVHRLASAGATVVAMGSGADGYGERLTAEGIAFAPIPVALRGVAPLTDLRLVWTLWREFRRRRPAVVHAFTIKPAIYATLAAALAGVPVRVVTITGLGYAFTSAGAGMNKLVNLLYRLALARAKRVYFQNADDRDLFVSNGLVDNGKVRLVAGSGVDTSRFVPAVLPCESRVPLTFCMISRLLGEKGVREYLNAAQRIRRDYPDVKFLLVGGTDPRNPTALAQSEVTQLGQQASAVEWIGEVDDVRPQIARADVVVLPSYREGLPRVLLEASAMGRALIASDVPGCRQVVLPGVTGLLVPPADVDRLELAMRELIANPGRISAMGAAGRAFVVEHFDEGAVIEQTIADYALLISV